MENTFSALGSTFCVMFVLESTCLIVTYLFHCRCSSSPVHTGRIVDLSHWAGKDTGRHAGYTQSLPKSLVHFLGDDNHTLKNEDVFLYVFHQYTVLQLNN